MGNLYIDGVFSTRCTVYSVHLLYNSCLREPDHRVSIYRAAEGDEFH